ncbi:hypothetical protein JZ751_015875 [Albula glossodonta]|uniref:RNF31 C-terminal domain-containing protein n=1 Tax=Albula glossodonta TaxID=121402 RepID=A0A8T2MUR9_9TELE|nr:hypothetical protein JZ751_015875 [Albula glossodonta]
MGVILHGRKPSTSQECHCGVMTQKEEEGRQFDSTCGKDTQPGQAGLCDKHYKEYLVGLINDNSIDPAPLFDDQELDVTCRRYKVVVNRLEAEEDRAYHARLLKFQNSLQKAARVGSKPVLCQG